MRSDDLSVAIARNAERIVARYLPAAKRRGDVCLLGDRHGAAGESLKIELRGERAGSWFDHATGEGGGLLSLLETASGRSAQALGQELLDAFGPQITRPLKTTAGAAPAASPSLRNKCPRLTPAGVAYFASRGLSEATVTLFRCGSNERAVSLPAYREGVLRFVKYRDIHEKRFYAEKGARPCLWGWQALPRGTTVLVITEGEIDAMSACQMGTPAVSLPQGAGEGRKLDWLEEEMGRLLSFERIVLALDNDEPGQQTAQALAARLSGADVSLVQWPEGVKDANDLLVAGRGDEWVQLVAGAVEAHGHPLVAATALAGAAAVIASGGGVPSGSAPWPFPELEGRVWLRPGTVTLLAGEASAGKSTLTKQIALDIRRRGEPVLFAPLEYSPDVWLSTLVRTVLGHRRASREDAERALLSVAPGLFILDETRANLPTDLAPVIGYASRRYGVRHVIIDNLARCGVPEDDYPAQAALVIELGKLAKSTNTSILLVSHLRKNRTLGGSGLGEVKGSGGITDMADSVVFLRRFREEDDARCDARLSWRKARYDGDEPYLDLWYDRDSDRLLSQQQGGGLAR
jgi:twinkle protein